MAWGGTQACRVLSVPGFGFLWDFWNAKIFQHIYKKNRINCKPKPCKRPPAAATANGCGERERAGEGGREGGREVTHRHTHACARAHAPTHMCPHYATTRHSIPLVACVVSRQAGAAGPAPARDRPPRTLRLGPAEGQGHRVGRDGVLHRVGGACLRAGGCRTRGRQNRATFTQPAPGLTAAQQTDVRSRAGAVEGEHTPWPPPFCAKQRPYKRVSEQPPPLHNCRFVLGMCIALFPPHCMAPAAYQ